MLVSLSHRSDVEHEADMATVRKTITLTEQQDAWIAAQIAAGRYGDDSEAIGDLIQPEQEQVAERDAIRHALIEGERSGTPQRFDVAAFKRRKIAGHG
jgi:antitoxin ParD1/3/4